MVLQSCVTGSGMSLLARCGYGCQSWWGLRTIVWVSVSKCFSKSRRRDGFYTLKGGEYRKGCYVMPRQQAFGWRVRLTWHDPLEAIQVEPTTTPIKHASGRHFPCLPTPQTRGKPNFLLKIIDTPNTVAFIAAQFPITAGWMMLHRKRRPRNRGC